MHRSRKLLIIHNHIIQPVIYRTHRKNKSHSNASVLKQDILQIQPAVVTLASLFTLMPLYFSAQEKAFPKLRWLVKRFYAQLFRPGNWIAHTIDRCTGRCTIRCTGRTVHWTDGALPWRCIGLTVHCYNCIHWHGTSLPPPHINRHSYLTLDKVWTSILDINRHSRLTLRDILTSL